MSTFPQIYLETVWNNIFAKMDPIQQHPPTPHPPPTPHEVQQQMPQPQPQQAHQQQMQLQPQPPQQQQVQQQQQPPVAPTPAPEPRVLEDQFSVYQSVFNYLTERKYPLGYNKLQKRNLRKRAEKFSVKDSTLFHFMKGRLLQVIRSRIEQISIMRVYHYNDVGIEMPGLCQHIDKERMVDKITERYYWRSLANDVASYIHNCSECQIVKHTQRELREKAKLKMEISMRHNRANNHQPARVWNKVIVDILTLQQNTSDGYRYIVCVMDTYSYWPEAKPLVQYTPEAVAAYLYELSCRYGFAEYQINQQTSEFVSHVSEAFRKMVGMDIKITNLNMLNEADTSENGWQHQLITLQQKFIQLAKELPQQWPWCLHGVLARFRTSMLPNRGQTPYFLMFGRDYELPGKVKMEIGSQNSEKHLANGVDMVKNSLHHDNVKEEQNQCGQDYTCGQRNEWKNGASNEISQGENNMYNLPRPGVQSPNFNSLNNYHGLSPNRGSWSTVAVEVVSFPCTPDGFSYVLLVVDHCSKWPEAKSMPGKNSGVIAYFLYELTCRFGYAEYQFNSCDKELVDQVHDEVNKLMDNPVKVTRSASSSYGVDVVIRDGLVRLACEFPLDWPWRLNRQLFALRHRKHPNTQHSPYSIMFSKEAVVNKINPEEDSRGSKLPENAPPPPENTQQHPKATNEEAAQLFDCLSEQDLLTRLGTNL